jgi:capsular polysaccharide export protein
VLVPGQVEDDASIRQGCESVRTNLALLEAARVACPEAFIVYKPHPDVASGNRRGQVPPDRALAHADWIEQEASLVSCIEAADAVHTMTSMAGFEALLRGKSVIVFGRPFYAGWGLTEDRLAIPRRTRSLSLDELVTGVLLRYPLYWDWELKGFTSCEAVLRRLIVERDELVARGKLGNLKSGWLRRQLRKGRSLLMGLWDRSRS